MERFDKVAKVGYLLALRYKILKAGTYLEEKKKKHVIVFVSVSNFVKATQP